MKQITITVPDNCELKQDGNTYTIVEKEKKLTYKDIVKELFSKHYCYIETDGAIANCDGLYHSTTDLTNCTSRRQAQKLLAINKLMNVAKYLNGDWQPDWDDVKDDKYFITLKDGEITFDAVIYWQSGDVYFKSKKLAKQAIEILGEETIRLALCTDY